MLKKIESDTLLHHIPHLHKPNIVYVLYSQEQVISKVIIHDLVIVRTLQSVRTLKLNLI